MKTRNLLSSLLVLIFSFGLVACSGEPSSSDIKKVIEADFEKANKLLAAMAAMTKKPAPKIELKSVNKIGCEEVKDQKDTYKCNVEVEAALPNKPAKKETGIMLMVKGKDGWTGKKVKK
jgi:hypothetical protein